MYIRSENILAESCLREVNGERIALDTASSLLEPDEELLASASGSSAARGSRFLSLLFPEDLDEKAMPRSGGVGSDGSDDGSGGGECG